MPVQGSFKVKKCRELLTELQNWLEISCESCEDFRLKIEIVFQ